MSKTVRVLTAQLSSEINEQEVQMFRGAMLNVIGTGEPTLSSGHKEDGTCRQRYPLIQYKRIGGRAAIICIEQGIEAVIPLLENTPEKFHAGSREVPFNIIEVTQSETIVQLIETGIHYNLYSWLALNHDNERRYECANGIKGRAEVLETVLCGNILSMLKGLDIYLDGQLNVSITDFKERRRAYVKGFPMRSFDASFTANIIIPQYIGLGKSASKGHGIVIRKQ